MEEYKNDELFENHVAKICMCECDTCSNRSPHPGYNCYKDCEETKPLDEPEKLKLGLYKRCLCNCNICHLSK